MAKLIYLTLPLRKLFVAQKSRKRASERRRVGFRKQASSSGGNLVGMAEPKWVLRMASR